MSAFVQTLLGLVAGAVLLGVGFLLGSVSETPLIGVRLFMEDELSVRVDGIPSEKVECLKWASVAFGKEDGVTAGVLSLVCNGSLR